MLVEADLIIRQDIAANWANNNPILENGQEGFETDTRKSKVGRGVEWNATDYRFSGTTGASIISYASGTPQAVIVDGGIQVTFTQGYTRVTGIQLVVGGFTRNVSVQLQTGAGMINGFLIDEPGITSFDRVDFVAQ